MREQDYPEVFRAADRGALVAQRVFVGLKVTEIGCLLASAAASGIAIAPGQSPSTHFLAPAISIGGVIMALLIAIYGAVSQVDSAWIDCRTLAESVKKLAWQFMMCVPPHGRSDARAAEAEFHLKLASLRKSLATTVPWVARYTTQAVDITDVMRANRNKTWQQQHLYYRKNRLRTQIHWYTANSNSFGTWAIRFMLISIALEALAVVFAIVAWLGTLPTYNGVGLATTMAAAAMGWSELRKHRQLGRTYHDISRRLSAQRDLARHVNSDEARIQFVDDVESIISTENTNWAIIRS